MTEEAQHKSVDSCSTNLIENMGVSNVNNAALATQPEKRTTLPVIYVPVSKNLNSSEASNSFTVPQVINSTSVPNGVNGAKGYQALVGTLYNQKVRQKVLLTPVKKPGKEKQLAVTRILVQGQRPGTVGQVARITGAQSSPSSSGLSVMIPPPIKPIRSSYMVSSSSIATPVTVSSSSTGVPSSGIGGPNSIILSNARSTLSIKNAVLIDSNGGSVQNKSTQPNIIRQKISTDGKMAINSLLKPSGLCGPSLLSKVLKTSTPGMQLRSGKEDDVVLIEDDEEDKVTTSKIKPQENGIKEPAGSSNGLQREVEIKKVPISSVPDRARKRKGYISASCEPPVKIVKQQDKLKLLPGAEEFDPFKVIEWQHNGLGRLPGSNIKMTINELGMLTVAEVTLAERGATPANAASDEDEGKSSSKKGNELDSILCCVSCSCYGLPAEFFNASYCSISCRDAVLAQEEALVKKLELEKEENSDSDQKKKNQSGSVSQSSNEDDDCGRIPSFIDDYSRTPGLSKAKKIVKKSKSMNSDLILSEDGEPDEDVDKTASSSSTLAKTPTKNDGKKSAILQQSPEANSIKGAKQNKPGLLTKTEGVRTRSSISQSSPVKYSATTHEVVHVDDGPSAPSGIEKPESSVNSNIPPSETCSRPSEVKSNRPVEVKSVRPVEVKNKRSTMHIVAQDLDCGLSTPNRQEKPEEPSQKYFPWNLHLAETNSRPAWVKLFKNPFPHGPNEFKVGYKLEAIDPEHQANVCAVTVVEVRGYRLKLHFDCFSDMFDFWVNADSPAIFPCGFCAQHNIPICPPQGHSKDTFNWLSYNTIWMATAAPAKCFPNYSTFYTAPNLFKVGMKLEAIDRKNTFLVCVATVAGVIENRILVHFDSWGDIYDYWVDVSSPYIRPVGWCKENNHELTPPNGIKPADFNWKDYLLKTESSPVPRRAFTLRPHYDFRRGMKLEAIDKRAPHLLRVATVRDVLPYQIRIEFDGFPAHFGYWVDDDCPDIHPVGWGAQCGHPVQPPPDENSDSLCPTPGCFGDGNFKSNALENHSTPEECPYSVAHLKREPHIPDRYSYVNDVDKNEELVDFDTDDSGDESEDSKRWKWLGVREGVRVKRLTSATETERSQSKSRMKKKKKRKGGFAAAVNNSKSNRDAGVQTVFPKSLEEMEPFLSEKNPLNWTVNQVIEFTTSVLGFAESIKQLESEEVDGKALLMLAKHDLLYYLGFSTKLATKLCEQIELLRSKVT